MIGRREFAALGLGAVALAALDTKAVAAKEDHAGHGDHMGLSDSERGCAKACSDCQRECDSCAHHCAIMASEGKKEHLTTLATCMDCADICAAASQIVSRSGAFAMLICRVCAEACARCGKECEKFPKDAHMKRCAEECRRCEKACRNMKPSAGRAGRDA